VGYERLLGFLAVSPRVFAGSLGSVNASALAETNGICVPMGKYDWRKHEKKQRTREREVGNGARTVRLQELIREELNFLLRGEVSDPRLAGVEVTMVELLGETARVWFTSDNEREEDVRDALDGAAGFFRVDLAESLGLKRTPDLRFRRDPATRIFATTAVD
jgi:ribosome-binding factor A